jgi:acetoin utilization deacetylase AcuC-like enzyme
LTFLSAHQAPGFFLDWLPKMLDLMKDCDLVLYQAGADPHINDPHGGWLTTAQLQNRDAIVFQTLAKHGVPVAWDLAGGYQIEPDGSIPKVLEVHDNTMRECVRAFSDG